MNRLWKHFRQEKSKADRNKKRERQKQALIVLQGKVTGALETLEISHELASEIALLTTQTSVIPLLNCLRLDLADLSFVLRNKINNLDLKQSSDE